MGLAILEYTDTRSGEALFRIDLGSNRYYRFAVGECKTKSSGGVELLSKPSYVSEMMGPLQESSIGRGVLSIPVSRFSGSNRCIQMQSFRDMKASGPCVSEVVTLIVPAAGPSPLPLIQFNKESKTMHPQVETRAVPFRIEEERPISQAMFLQGLLGMLPSILPSLGSLFGGSGGSGGGILKSIAKPDTIKMITDLIAQISKAKSVIEEQADAKALAYGCGITGNLALKDAPMSEAMIAPALLAALPALMPLLKQVLTPETIKSVTDGLSPTKAIGAVTDSVVKIGKLGLQGQKQLMGHLEKALPKLASESDLLRLMENMSLASSIEPNYRRTEKVTLRFAGLVGNPVYGRTRTLFQRNRPMGFDFDFLAPSPIARARLTLSVKDSETLKLITHKSWPLKNVSDGHLQGSFIIQPERLSGMRNGDELLVSATVTWKNSKGKRFGTAVEALVTLIDECVFDCAEGTGEIIQLNDPVKYRAYWHKLWEGTFSRKHRRTKLGVTYYLSYDPERKTLGKTESKIIFNGESEKAKQGKLKSGMIFSPESLNALIPLISDEPLLGSSELEALSTDDFADRFSKVAKTVVDFRGRDGDSSSLWAYPAIKLQNVTLLKVKTSNPNGHITELEEKTVVFPVPALVHLVGLGSE